MAMKNQPRPKTTLTNKKVINTTSTNRLTQTFNNRKKSANATASSRIDEIKLRNDISGGLSTERLKELKKVTSTSKIAKLNSKVGNRTIKVKESITMRTTHDKKNKKKVKEVDSNQLKDGLMTIDQFNQNINLQESLRSSRMSQNKK